MPAGSAIMPAISLHMRVGQPRKERRQVAVPSRPQYQMPMIGHQTEIKDFHRRPFLGLDDQLNKSLIIPRLAKDFHPPVAPIEHMVNEGTDGRSGGSWHELKGHFHRL